MTARGPSFRVLLWGLIAVGLVGRTVLAFKTYGVAYDIDSQQAVRAALASHPLHVYAIVNHPPLNHWPYPPTFFVWLAASGWLSAHLGLAFHGVIQLPEIVADGAIAWFVQDHLRRREASERLRLAAVALVTLGPSFWIVSGFHAQIDAVAILPAVVALWLWERSPPGARRALIAGLLIGLGASIKTVPIFMLVVLLIQVRSRREAVALILPAIAVPLCALSPFLVADATHTLHSLRSHRALPGFGNLSLLIQPGFADQWLHHNPHRVLPLTRFLFDNEYFFLGLAMVPFVAVAFVRRLPATTAAALLWTALVTFNVGFGYEYVVWALPFALMAGYLWPVAAVQAALFPAAAMLYWHAFGLSSTAAYVAIVLATWATVVLVLVRWAAGLARATDRPRSAAPADGRHM